MRYFYFILTGMLFLSVHDGLSINGSVSGVNATGINNADNAVDLNTTEFETWVNQSLQSFDDFSGEIKSQSDRADIFCYLTSGLTGGIIIFALALIYKIMSIKFLGHHLIKTNNYFARELQTR